MSSRTLDSESGNHTLRRFNGDFVRQMEAMPSPGSTSNSPDKIEVPFASNGDDEFEVQFRERDDPENPKTFSELKKWTIMVIVSLSSASVACDSAIYTATYTQITTEFHCSELMATVGLSTFILGMGISPLFLSPLSEFYGRRPIYVISLLFSVIWLIVCVFAKNVQTIIIARLLGGLSGAAFLSVAGANAGDLFEHHELQLPMTIYSGIQFMGPEMGPIIGGFINYYATWHWTYYFMLIWTSIGLIATVFFVPETYRPVVLRLRVEKLRKEKNDHRYHIRSDFVPKGTVLNTVLRSLLRPFKMLVLEPMCLCLCLHSAVLLGILYLFFGAFPLVFANNHGFNLWQVGLTFLGLAVGILCGIATTSYWQSQYLRFIEKAKRTENDDGKGQPEFRLPQVIAGAVLVPVGLFFFGFTTYETVHYIVPIIASGVFGMGIFLSFSGTWTFLVDAYPLYAASGLAANSFTRSCFGAIFPLFGIQMYNKLGYDWATAVLAFITLAMVPFPYGKGLRRRSRFALAN
ncbi:related to multidrug resistant protein [Phialocephala subalpina]|uniref:Related to multidrug resistant protein n=1 Tax=Phialocephala subalpina TaxID=576137 RepID=A0A1L7XUE6_9HELO|nr:related to multidrug resistant protein [Phialocephala subalpina]